MDQLRLFHLEVLKFNKFNKKIKLLKKFPGKHLQTICDGSHFGEISLLIKGQKRTATVKALEICEIYKLSQRDFQKVIEPHREIVNRMEHIAHERIKSMLPSKQRKFSIPLRETH